MRGKWLWGVAAVLVASCASTTGPGPGGDPCAGQTNCGAGCCALGEDCCGSGCCALGQSCCGDVGCCDSGTTCVEDANGKLGCAQNCTRASDCATGCCAPITDQTGSLTGPYVCQASNACCDRTICPG